jgi:hypothetical protein
MLADSNCGKGVSLALSTIGDYSVDREGNDSAGSARSERSLKKDTACAIFLFFNEKSERRIK